MQSIEQGKDYDNLDESELPYVHVRNLGHGHSGTVEEVKDVLTHRVYARKTIQIPIRKALKTARTKVFHNEVNIIRTLGSHHHIVNVFATYVTKRHFGILLQPVASEGDLEHFIAEYLNEKSEHESDSSKRRLEAMTRVLEQGFGCLAAGLAFMHEKNIRHKDIKPRNILVHDGILIYTDFGYSFDSNGFTHSTTEGTPDFLTRRYSAPEVLLYDQRNSKSDVFSLGCVFNDMLSAMTQAIDFDDSMCFANIMDHIHSQLDKTLIPIWSILPGSIKSMTERARQGRSTAEEVVEKLFAQSKYHCGECSHVHGGGVNLLSQQVETTLVLDTTALRSREEPPSTDNKVVLPTDQDPDLLKNDLPTYTPWAWSQAHSRYYSYFLSGDSHMIDTIWSPAPKDKIEAETAAKPQEYHPIADSTYSSSFLITSNAKQPPSEPTATSLPADVQSQLKQIERRFIKTGNDTGNDRLLDPCYRRIAPHSHAAFYILGRVFKMMWSEPAGPANPGKSRNTTYFSTPMGEQALSEIRYFVVVKNKGTFSQCVPIQTYKGHASSNLNLGIIYTSSEAPSKFSNEVLTKYSIRVNPTTREHLEPTSRINYGKAYAVEHNVKVLDVGMVISEHCYWLQSYFEAAIRGN